MPNIRKSAFNAKNEKDKSAKLQKVVFVKATKFSVVLSDDSKYEIDLAIKSKYRIKRNCLYHGMFKKLGKIKYIEIQELERA